jgi:Cation transport ATPase
LLSANLVEIVVLSLGVLFSFLFAGNTLSEPFVPLLAVQILFINLVTDGFPALEIGISPPEPDLMDRQVQERGMSETFGPEVKRFIYLSLIVEAPMLFLIYLTGLSGGIDEARTRLFLAFISAELALSLTFGSMRYSIFTIRPHKGLTISVIVEVFLVAILILIPYTRDALQMLYPTIIDIVWAVIAGAVSLTYVEIFKHYIRKRVVYG